MSDPGAGGSEGVVGGPKTPQQIAAQRRLQQTQAQVDEVVGIMRVNVEKVLDRDQKLSELDDRADALQQGASQFEQQAGKLKRKFWLKNLKMMIIMGVIGLIIIIIIGVSIFGGGSSDSSPAVTPKSMDVPIAAPTVSPSVESPSADFYASRWLYEHEVAEVWKVRMDSGLEVTNASTQLPINSDADTTTIDVIEHGNEQGETAKLVGEDILVTEGVLDQEVHEDDSNEPGHYSEQGNESELEGQDDVSTKDSGLRDQDAKSTENGELRGHNTHNDKSTMDSGLRDQDAENTEHVERRGHNDESTEDGGLSDQDAESTENGELRGHKDEIIEDGGLRDQDAKSTDNGELRGHNDESIEDGGLRDQDAKSTENGELRGHNDESIEDGGLRDQIIENTESVGQDKSENSAHDVEGTTHLGRMLARGHDVLDPALEVMAVPADPKYTLKDVPILRGVKIGLPTNKA